MDSKRTEAYEPPLVVDLGRLEDLTQSGTMGGAKETGKT
jgi:hypothetical protein